MKFASAPGVEGSPLRLNPPPPQQQQLQQEIQRQPQLVPRLASLPGLDEGVSSTEDKVKKQQKRHHHHHQQQFPEPRAPTEATGMGVLAAAVMAPLLSRRGSQVTMMTAAVLRTSRWRLRPPPRRKRTKRKTTRLVIGYGPTPVVRGMDLLPRSSCQQVRKNLSLSELN